MLVRRAPITHLLLPPLLFLLFAQNETFHEGLGPIYRAIILWIMKWCWHLADISPFRMRAFWCSSFTSWTHFLLLLHFPAHLHFTWPVSSQELSPREAGNKSTSRFHWLRYVAVIAKQLIDRKPWWAVWQRRKALGQNLTGRCGMGLLEVCCLGGVNQGTMTERQEESKYLFQQQ